METGHESPHGRARRLARSLREALDVERSFGVGEAVLPPRTGATVDLLPQRSCAENGSQMTTSDGQGEFGTTLEAVASVVSACESCTLCETRNLTVFGSGSPTADLLIIGEAPGADEDRTGLPFVGRAGKLLTKMLSAIDLDRERDVYICNILKCRPPGNRDPNAAEISACLPYLRRQIEIISPKVILTLGAPSSKTMLETKAAISAIRGKIFDRFGARLVPSFHPAYLLRNPAAKRESWDDLKLIRQLIDGPEATESANF